VATIAAQQNVFKMVLTLNGMRLNMMGSGRERH
jgi:hypothetical protein